MATAQPKDAKEQVFEWEGKDRNGKLVRGEIRAAGENQVLASLRRQGILPSKVKKRKMRSGKKVTPKDLTIFTRQLATMMKAGVPLLQAFDIVARGNPNPSVTRLLNDIRNDVETGTSLSTAFRKYPIYFDNLYCNLVEAGEQAGILDQLLDRLAVYMEKTQAIKQKIKSALMYPISVIVVAFVVVAVIMIFVIPAFKQVFSSFGADLPAPTLFVIGMSEFFVAYWWLIFGGIGGGLYFFFQAWKRNRKMQQTMDRLLLKVPVFGVLINKSCIARWTRTLSTMFAAGVPLVEALDSVGGASGNSVYEEATLKIQHEVSTGTSLTVAMTNVHLFPTMVLQMCAIGEESGSIDHMLGKAADFYEAEVDDMVAGLSSLMAAASSSRCTCLSSSWARWSDAGLPRVRCRHGRRAGAADRQFPQCGDLPPAQDHGAAMGNRVRRTVWPGTCTGGDVQPAGATLALPDMRSPDPLVRERPGPELPFPARQMLVLRHPHRPALPSGRAGFWRPVLLLHLALGGDTDGPGLVRLLCRHRSLGADRLGYHPAARQHHPAFALGWPDHRSAQVEQLALD
jgi:type IV pilus assembly protein PilC